MSEGSTGTEAGVTGQILGLEDLFDLAQPQPKYLRIIEDQGGFMRPMDGLAMTYSRELVDHVLRSHDVFSSDGALDLGNVRPLIPLNIDPPDHSKYRKILDPLFAPRRMDAQEADIAARANHFIDTFIDKGECNFTEEFAELFPSSVFLGLMGLPEDDLATFIRMRDGIIRPQVFDPDAAFVIEARQKVQRATGQDIYAYFNRVLDERQATPTDDILTHFLQAEVEGHRLTREEILDICFLFLLAGLDTVSDSLSCFYAYLAQHPDQRKRIVDDPSIIPSAVEELLRWESPVPGGAPRMAKEDTTLPNGEKIAAGTAVMISYGAANVDPSVFPDGFEVRLDREVNPHIAFGGGVHRCLGSHLARRELRVVLREWHRRIPDYRIKEGHEKLEYAPGLRSVKDLTLVWPA